MMLVGVDQFDVLVELDVGGGDFALLVDGEQQGLRLAGVRLEHDLLEVQHDVGDIFHHALNGGELVHRAVNLDGGDGGAFEGGKQHAAQGVANGVAVTGFKRFGDELGVGFGGG